MALIFADSFDHYEVSGTVAQLNGKWENTEGTRVNGRRGTYGMRLNNSTLQKNLAPQTTLIIGMACFCDYETATLNTFSQVFGDAEGGFGITVGNDSNKYCRLGLSSDGRFRVSRGAYPQSSPDDGGGSYVGSGRCLALWTSSEPVFKFGQWNYLEWKITAKTDNTGSFTLVLNGEEIDTVTGIRTVPFARGDDVSNPSYLNPENFTQLIVHFTTGTRAIDDLYVLNTQGTTNNNFLGDLYVDCIKPDGAGLESDSVIIGTSPQPTRWQSVLTANGGVSAVQFDATGEADSYTFENLPYSDATVYGVQVVAQARKEDSGPARMTLTNSFDASPDTTTDASPTLLTPSAGEVYAFRTATLDESANGAWTYADIQAAQFGVRREELP